MPKYISTTEDVDRFFEIDPDFDPGVNMELLIPYNEAKEFAKGLHLLSVLEWFKAFDENSKSYPHGIPRRPHAAYEEFESYDIFLGLDKKNMSKIEIAEEYLVRVLGSGTVSANEIFKEAEKQGIFERTIRRAKKNLSIKTHKKPDGWFWSFSS